MGVMPSAAGTAVTCGAILFALQTTESLCHSCCLRMKAWAIDRKIIPIDMTGATLNLPVSRIAAAATPADVHQRLEMKMIVIALGAVAPRLGGARDTTVAGSQVPVTDRAGTLLTTGAATGLEQILVAAGE